MLPGRGGADVDPVLVRIADGEVALEGEGHNGQAGGAHRHVGEHVQVVGHVADDAYTEEEAREKKERGGKQMRSASRLSPSFEHSSMAEIIFADYP